MSDVRINLELLARARAGDKAARTEILRAHEPALQAATADEDERHELRVAMDHAIATWTQQPGRGGLIAYARVVRRNAARRERERAHAGREFASEELPETPLGGAAGAQIAELMNEAAAAEIDAKAEARAAREAELRRLDFDFADLAPPRTSPPDAEAEALAAVIAPSRESALRLVDELRRSLFATRGLLLQLERLPLDLLRVATNRAPFALPLNRKACAEIRAVVSFAFSALLNQDELRAPLAQLAARASALRKQAALYPETPSVREIVVCAEGIADAWLRPRGADLVEQLVASAIDGDDEAVHLARKGIATLSEGVVALLIALFDAESTALRIDAGISQADAKARAIDWLEGKQFADTSALARSLQLAALIGLGLSVTVAHAKLGKP